MTIETTGEYTEGGADYYDCCDREVFTYSTEADAMEEFIDMQLNPSMTPADIEAKIREIDSLEVTAYYREEWTEDKITRCAELAAERVNEAMTEDYGDPDGDGVFDDDELVEAFTEALRKVKKPELWLCGKFATRTYQGDDLVAKCREYFPSWFEVSP